MIEISNRVTKRVRSLNEHEYRHSAIQAMLAVSVLLSEYLVRRDDPREDEEQYLSQMGFCEEDRRVLTHSDTRKFCGQGRFSTSDILDLLIQINGKEEIVNMGGYNIFGVIFSSKQKTPKDIFYGIRGLSRDGKEALTDMLNVIEKNLIVLYGQYFYER